MNYKLWGKRVGIGVVSVFLLTTAFFAGLYTDAQLTSNVSTGTPSSVINQTVGQPSTADFTTFWKVWQLLDQNFVYTGTSTATTTSQDREYGAIQGMVASLGDPYTEFFPPEENKDFQTELSGSVSGVGVEVGIKNNLITVIAPVKGSPADLAGVKAGDEIVGVNSKDVTSLSADDVVNLIRGPAGTQVSITVSRNGSDVTLNMTREEITVPSVETQKISNGILLITVNEFDVDVADQFRDALREFVSGGYDKMIIDVRDNPGGYLDGAVDMASWFVPIAKTIVTEDFGNSSGKQPIVHRSYGYGPIVSNGNVVVLVNGGSASASEIFAAALQEYGIAKLVGEQTFGKGSVQELIPVTSDTSLKVTIARWLTPTGESISEKGLTPDFVIPFTEAEAASGTDPQLQKAEDILNGSN